MQSEVSTIDISLGIVTFIVFHGLVSTIRFIFGMYYKKIFKNHFMKAVCQILMRLNF